MAAVYVNGTKAKCIGISGEEKVYGKLHQSKYVGKGLIPILENQTGFIDYSKSFEISIKFNIKGSSNVLLLGSEGNEYNNPSIAIYDNWTNIWYSYSVNGREWEPDQSVYVQNGLSANTWYTIVYGIEVGSVNTQYCKLLDNNGNIIAQNSNTVSNLPYNNLTTIPEDLLKFFGNVNYQWIDQDYIDFDISGTYIKNDGNLIWGCDN